MEKGKSSMATSRVLPTNSFLVILMAAVIPTTVLMGTATAVSSSVIFNCAPTPTFQPNISSP
jgi:hypothetical protein